VKDRIAALRHPMPESRFDLVIINRGRSRQTPIPLELDVINRLAIEATFRGTSIADTVGAILTAWCADGARR
jgi:hypothetical protein